MLATDERKDQQMLEKIVIFLQYPFVLYALIVGVLIALSSSLLGLTLVLKRFSFIGDGLSHVAFGAMACATVAGFSNPMPLTLLFTILCAVFLLRTGENSKVKGDAAIAMVSVGALAFGYLLLNLFPSSSNLSGDVCTSLFGSTSILTLSPDQVYFCLALSLLVVGLYLFFYHKIFAITFDEHFARAVGCPVRAYHFFLAVIVAMIIVLSMSLVGSLLTSALLIFPALSAMRLFQNFRTVTIASAILSVFSALLGIFLSIIVSTPVGATIVLVELFFFLLFSLIGRGKS